MAGFKAIPLFLAVAVVWALVQTSPGAFAERESGFTFRLAPDAKENPADGEVTGNSYALPKIAKLGQSTPLYDRPVVLDGRPGDRGEIGLFTEWQSEMLATGRNRELIIQQADSLLDLPWCDYTAMTLPYWREGKYSLSFAHVPNLFFLPYLLTGDTRYVAPMECLYAILQEWPARSSGSALQPSLGRDGKRPMFWLTGRDYAWSLRNLAQLAFIERRGDTEQQIYLAALENTRQAALARMRRPIESGFHVLGENQLSGVEQWSAWFEGFIGMVVNHAINLGFEEWKPIAEWHFKHLEWRCGGKWPMKACDSDHITLEPGASWENTPPYNPERMDCYLAAADEELMPTKCGDVFMTYDDRAQIARSWAAMAAVNGVPGAADLYARLDALIQRRGGERWYKYAMLPEVTAGDAGRGSPALVPAKASNPPGAPLAQARATPEPEVETDAAPGLKPARKLQVGEAANSLAEVPPGTWFEIPDSSIADILPPESFQQPIHYIVGPRAITGAWNGAVFNSQLQRLDIFASGGHGDYCGNEYLGFSLRTLRWQLVHGPSDLTGFDLKSGTVEGKSPTTKGFAPDGKPISRHTYGGQVYHPEMKKSFMFGGSLCSGAGSGDDRWWSVTADGQYTLLGGTGEWASLGNSAEYDPVSKNIWLTESGNVIEYDVNSNKKIRRTNTGSNSRWGQVSAIDPNRNILFVFGHDSPDNSASGAYTYNLKTGVRQQVTLSGDLSIVERPGVGLEFIPELDLYAAWIEGPILYLIDPDSFRISAYETRGTPPAEASPNGVYGRFAYSAEYGGFVVVTAIDQNVSFLKLPEL